MLKNLIFIMKLPILLFLITSPLLIFGGGPWLVPKKSGFLQVQSTFPAGSYSDLFLKGNKNSALNRSVLDYTFQGYLEYGITDNLNLLTTLPYKYVSTGDATSSLADSTLLPKGNLNGLGNYKLALKYRVYDKNIKVAVSVQSIFKSIHNDLEKGLTTGYNANSIGLYIHTGKSFSNKFYSFIEGGINTVSNDFSDYIELHYELGYQLKPPFWTVFTLDLRESLKGGSYQNKKLQQTGLYTNDQEYFAYGIKASYELKNKIGFTAATFGAFSGNFVAKVATFSIGVYKKW
jgi:hypothetical protein